MEIQNDLISVIVPVYNIEQYVGACIESIIKQTYKNLEIILVDDGSTDRSSSLCDLYAEKDNRIKVIHKLNGGLVSARKAGVLAANGKYVGYVDGDDWIECDFYEKLYMAAVKSQAEVICAGFSRDLFDQHIRLSNNILDGIYEESSIEMLRRKMLSYDELYSVGIYTYVWNKLFLREIVLQPQLNVDERITIGEDAAVTYPCLLCANRIYVCDYSEYHYRQHATSMLKQHSDAAEELTKLSYLYYYLKKQFEKLDTDNAYDLHRQLYHYILSNCIIRVGGFISKNKQFFDVDVHGKNVILVQAGSFGQIMHRRLKDTEYCHIVGWFDEDYWEYRRNCMDVDPYSDICKVNFDYAIIAKVDPLEIVKLKEKLILCGVLPSKIVEVKRIDINIEDLFER